MATTMIDLLVEGLDDWVHAYTLAHVGRRAFASADDVIAATVAELGRLAAAGLLEIGELADDGRFTAWPLSPADAAAAVEAAWRALGRDPHPGEVAWFCNTERGDAVARAFEAQAAPQGD